MRGTLAALCAALLTATTACTAAPAPPAPPTSTKPAPFTEAYALTSAVSKAAVAKEWVRTVDTVTEGGVESSRAECLHAVRNLSSRDCRYEHQFGSQRRGYRMVFTNYIFMELPAEWAAQTGKPWTKVDPWYGNSPLDRTLATIADRFPSPAAIDRDLPRGSRIESSDEVLDGRQVTHYRSAVQFTDLHATAESDRERAHLKQLMDSGLSEMSTDVWVDSDGLLVRLETDEPVLGGGRSITTRTFTQWGVPGVIEEPAPELLGPAPEIT
ncbi:hypothetical protein FKR81_34850 [Lentzea tibetensis]|uniref:Lipoprotein n=1 Tax=Lentzea tibetensis TaxID=2591470 RepID=A0A563EIV6_9PSEU|nr:hypothetical protein [Lentzea tibetensis]TWP46766.1 hypothetical protein FKR81_34850 [Lentzea tibetensis]